MERIEVGRYAKGQVGNWIGWLNPEREKGYKVPKWMLFIYIDGTVRLGVRDDEKDELFFS
ncbi:hypothetical protein LCGC14_1094230 [marine sediment metagenome]|uniref:Uncharacterized protein n=1 Tax=marine sediment metagenome TaxID=412755 RepID=A0A0F9MZ94_9ZZZZ